MSNADQAVANAAHALTLDARLDLQTKQIVGIMLRGFLVSSPGVPPDALLRSLARVTGACLSEALMGDLADVLKLRATMKDEFCKTVDSIKPKPLPTIGKAN